MYTAVLYEDGECKAYLIISEQTYTELMARDLGWYYDTSEPIFAWVGTTPEGLTYHVRKHD